MDLDKLNSATKYPSILTYHEMGDRGRLTQKVQVPFPAGQTIHLTEKIDGTNARIIVLPDGPRKYIIGSREEFLFAQGDLIFGKEYGIVKTLQPIADNLSIKDVIRIFYFEIFGAGLPAAKQYTDGKITSARVFDIAEVPLDILENPIDRIAAWRDHGGQTFYPKANLEEFVRFLSIAYKMPIGLVPSMESVQELPTTLEATYEWLKTYEKSLCDLGGGQGHAEGIVARTEDRKTIAKIKFEDYERTLGVKRGR